MNFKKQKKYVNDIIYEGKIYAFFINECKFNYQSTVENNTRKSGSYEKEEGHWKLKLQIS